MATALCEVPIKAVEDELVVLAGQVAAGTCRWLLLPAEFDRWKGWDSFGIASCAHWLSIRLAISPSTGQARFTRPDGGPVLALAATTGTPADIPEPVPDRTRHRSVALGQQPLLLTELTPPHPEDADPTALRFASWRPPDEVAGALAATLGCRFTEERSVWMTSTPDLITNTPGRR